MQNLQSSIGQRVVGAARLDVATYEAVERDVNANTQALIVVVLAAIASGIGSLGVDGASSFVTGLIGALVGWIIYALRGSGLPHRHPPAGNCPDAGDLRRSSPHPRVRPGPASAPGPPLIPLLGWLIAVAVGIWVLVATIIAIRQSMELTTGRAIGTAVIAWLIYIIVNALILTALAF